MKKRMIAFLLVVTMMVSSVGDIFQSRVTYASAQEAEEIQSQDLENGADLPGEEEQVPGTESDREEGDGEETADDVIVDSDAGHEGSGDPTPEDGMTEGAEPAAAEITGGEAPEGEQNETGATETENSEVVSAEGGDAEDGDTEDEDQDIVIPEDENTEDENTEDEYTEGENTEDENTEDEHTEGEHTEDEHIEDDHLEDIIQENDNTEDEDTEDVNQEGIVPKAGSAENDNSEGKEEETTIEGAVAEGETAPGDESAEGENAESSDFDAADIEDEDIKDEDIIDEDIEGGASEVDIVKAGDTVSEDTVKQDTEDEDTEDGDIKEEVIEGKSTAPGASSDSGALNIAPLQMNAVQFVAAPDVSSDSISQNSEPVAADGNSGMLLSVPKSVTEPEDGEGTADDLLSEPNEPTASPVRLMATGPLRAPQADPAGGNQEGRSVLEDMIMEELMNSAVNNKLSGRVEVILSRNMVYEGNKNEEVNVLNGTYTVDKDFILELSAEDAGEDGVSGLGQTIIDANVLFRGFRVIMNSIMMAKGRTITLKDPESDTGAATDLTYNGTNTLANELTVKVGKSSSLTVNTGDQADKINVTAESGAKSVTINAGDGPNTVNASIGGGDLKLTTGADPDTVKVQITGSVGEIDVNSGAGNDTLYILDNGKAKENKALISAGSGDDYIDLDVRAEAGNLTVDTGLGIDSVTVVKGDFNTADDLDYNHVYNPYETVATEASTTVVTLKNGDKDSVDRYTIDVAASRAIKGIELDHMEDGKGASVYMKGILKEDAADPIEWVMNGNSRKGIKFHTSFISQTTANNDYTLEVTAKNNDLSKYNFTDSLKNKKTVEIYPKTVKQTVDGKEIEVYEYADAYQDFTNYVFKSPVSNIDKIIFPIPDTHATPLTLSTVVLDAEQTTEAYDGFINVNDVDAQGMNVLINAKAINIKGTIKAQNVRAESAQASKGMFDFISPLTTNSGGTAGDYFDVSDLEKYDGIMGTARNILNIYETAMINVEGTGKIETTHDIDLVARIKQFGGILAVAATLNVVMAKIAIANVNIERGAELTAEEGTVNAEAKIESISGMKLVDVERDGGNIETVWNKDAGMPLGIHVVYHDAAVEIEEGSKITAGEDVLLKSKTDIVDYNYADADTSYAIAATVIVNKVATTVAGEVTAGNNVKIVADSKILDDTEASQMKAAKNGALNAYIAVNVVYSNVEAIVEEAAKITARRGNIDILANSAAETLTYAVQGKSPTGGMPEAINPGQLVVTILKYAIGAIIVTGTAPVSVPAILIYKKIANSPARVANKLVKLRAQLAGGDYDVKVVNFSEENAEMGSATVELKIRKESAGHYSTWATDGGADNLVAVITPKPKAGYKVKKVMVRWLDPTTNGGKNQYTYQEVTKSKVENDSDLWAYTFAMPMENTNIKGYEVIVIFEAGEQADNIIGLDEVDNYYDDVFNLNGLINDVEEIGEDAENDDDGYVQLAKAEGEEKKTFTLQLTQHELASQNGWLLTWQQEYNEKDKKYQSLTSVHNGEKIRFVANTVAGMQLDALEISYQVLNTETNQNETKTVKIAKNENGLFVFTIPEDAVDASTITVKPTYGPAPSNGVAEPNQKTGALAVDVILNKGKAIIESGSEVTAGKGINMLGMHTTTSDNIADGTAVDQTTETIVPKTKDIPWEISKWTVGGAQYAVKAESSIGGTLTGTIQNSEGASFTHPEFTYTPPAAPAAGETASEDYTFYSQAKKVKIVFSYYTKYNFGIMPGGAGTLVNVVFEVDLETLDSQNVTPVSDGGALGEDMLRQFTSMIGATTLQISRDANGALTFQPNLSNFAVMDGTTFKMGMVFEDENGDALHSTQGVDQYVINHPISLNVNGKLNKTADAAIQESDIHAYGNITYVVGDSTATKYYFDIVPEDGYKLDADGGPASNANPNIHKSNTDHLYATWKGSDGATKKAPLKRDSTGKWYFDIADSNISVPDGATIRICAVFEEDTRKVEDGIRNEQDRHGEFEIYDSKDNKIDKAEGVKKGENLTIRVTPKEGWGAAKVIIKTANGAEKEINVASDGYFHFKIDSWDDTTTSDYLVVTPVYEPRTKTINKDNSNNIQLSIGDQKSFTGEMITVLPSEEQIAAGMKIKNITVNNTTYSDNVVSFAVPDADAVSVSAELTEKAYDVKSYTHPLGYVTIKCATAKVDGGDVVDVKVEANGGYHAKAGTVKAIIKYAGGGEKKQTLTWTAPDTYRFVVPSGNIQSIELVGEIEKGEDAKTSSKGVSVAVNVVRSENKVEIEGGKVTAGEGLNMSGISLGNKVSTQAKAGYSEGYTGLAGALAVQVASEKTKVIIHKDEDAEGFITAGKISLSGNTKDSFKTVADASGTKKDTVSEKRGVGAGIAVAVDRFDTISRIEDGVRLNPDQTEKTLGSLTVKATQKADDTVKAVAGAAGGTSFVPVIAVDVYQAEIKAEVGKFNLGGSNTLKVTGPVNISAKATSPKVQYNHDISADASARGGTSAIGATMIINWVTTEAKAILNQSLNADGDVKVFAHSADALRAVAAASAAGGVAGKTDSNKSIATQQTRLTQILEPKSKQSGKSLLHVFNRNDNNGYIIVAADDKVSPIIAYSDAETLDLDDMPDNLRSWLEYMCEQMTDIIDNNALPLNIPAHAIQQEITPMIKTQWGQGSPYNSLCPTNGNGNKCLMRNGSA